MAFTNIKRQEDTAQQQGPVSSNNAYKGLNGVSQNTANNLGNYQSGYKPSQTVAQRQQELQTVQQQKPQSFSSKYSTALDNILGQINGQAPFKADLASDPNWNYFLDLYQQKGKQAAADVGAQSAALTGGYGNSYGTVASNQQYQQYLLDAYGMAPQFMEQQRANWQANQQGLKDQYAVTSDAYNNEYGQYRDLVSDWERDYDRANQGYLDERNFDYNDYQQNLDYWSNMAAQENKDYWSQQQFDESKREFDASLSQSAEQFEATNKLNWSKLEEDQRQFDASLSEKQRAENREVAISYVNSILANGQIPSDELLIAAGLSLEDAQKLIKQATAGGPGPAKYNGNLDDIVVKSGLIGINNALGYTPENAANSLATAEQDNKLPKIPKAAQILKTYK